MKIVLGALVYIIIIIIVIVIIIALLKFLFQLFFVISVGSDYYAIFCTLKKRNSIANELNDIVFNCTVFVIAVAWTITAYNGMISCYYSPTWEIIIHLTEHMPL